MTIEETAELVKRATEGDQQALEKVIISIKDLVYNLSLRMLLYPEDAKDATQEILVKIVTRLSAFRAESAFDTWVYRVASNYLISTRGKNTSRFISRFEDCEKLIDTLISESIAFTQNLGEQDLLEEEIKVSCTHGLLICLSEKSRMAYILGQLLEFSSPQGGEILGISADSFRKQLSGSRKHVRNFLDAKCGLMNPKNLCRCKKKIDYLIDNKVISPGNLRFAVHSQRSIDLVDQINSLERSAAIYRSTPQFSAPDIVIKKMKELIKTI